MIRHMCISVRGALTWSNSLAKRLAPTFLVDGIPLKTAAQVRRFLQKELDMGHEMLPTGGCDNFDWKTGCKGHVGAPTGAEGEETK